VSSYRIGRPAAVVVALAVLVAAAAGGVYAAVTRAGATPTAARHALAAADNPIGARGRTLGLSKVTIPGGVHLALHHHSGTQVAYIAGGALTYSVKSGSVTVRQGAADGGSRVMFRISAGHTGVIHAGEWIVEQPTTIHSATNRTSSPVVVYLATLFPVGSPASVPNG
jgi:quercetin dioxygenase-like cupin family protein